MLDTDSVSFAFRGEGRIATRIAEHAPSELCVSAITVAALRYGAERRRSARLHDLIDALTGNVVVLPFDEACASRFGLLASELAAKRSSIGEFDTMIAAHALTVGATLVTNNVKDFNRVRGLHVENWS